MSKGRWSIPWLVYFAVLGLFAWIMFYAASERNRGLEDMEAAKIKISVILERRCTNVPECERLKGESGLKSNSDHCVEAAWIPYASYLRGKREPRRPGFAPDLYVNCMNGIARATVFPASDIAVFSVEPSGTEAAH